MLTCNEVLNSCFVYFLFHLIYTYLSRKLNTSNKIQRNLKFCKKSAMEVTSVAIYIIVLLCVVIQCNTMASSQTR